MAIRFLAAGALAAGIGFACTFGFAAEPAAEAGLTAASCTADNAKAAGESFTALPGAGWHYMIHDPAPAKRIVEWKNVTPPSPRSRHADRYEGLSPATATCIPVDAQGKASPNVLSFKIAVGGETPRLIGDDVVCVGATPVKDYTGQCDK